MTVMVTPPGIPMEAVAEKPDRPSAKIGNWKKVWVSDHKYVRPPFEKECFL